MERILPFCKELRFDPVENLMGAVWFEAPVKGLKILYKRDLQKITYRK